jgi:acetyl-CoA carboxylase/biotin carboxylase 1
VCHHLSFLPGRACGEVAFKAGGLLRELGAPAFETRAAALREELKAAAAKGEGIDELAGSASLSTGVDLLTYLFSDDDVAVRNAALECYVRRLYRANTIIDIDVSELDDGLVACSFTFRFSDTPEAAAVLRKGLMVLLPGDPSDAPALTAQLPGAIAKLATDAAGGEKYDSPVNVLHFAYGSNSITEAFDGDDFADKTGVALAAVKKSLVDADVRTVNFALPVPPRLPRYFTFLHDEGE